MQPRPRRAARAALLAVTMAFAAAALSNAEETTPDSIRLLPSSGLDLAVNGIFQTWYTAQQSGPSSFLVRNARVSFAGDISPYVSFDIMPAFMSPVGLTLLNAYADIKPVDHLAFRVGQFVTPFGLDRMRAPGDLELANYHLTKLIFPGYASDLGWDDGVQAETKLRYIDVRAAVINGTGPNVTADTETSKDLTARVDLYPLGNADLLTGFSYYYGASHGASSSAPLFPNRKTWWGGHAQYFFLDHKASFQAEIITRSDSERLWTLQGSYRFRYWKDWQLVADWERFDPDTGPYTRRVTGGVNFWLDPKTRLTADYYNNDTGVGPSTNNLVMQFQVLF